MTLLLSAHQVSVQIATTVVCRDLNLQIRRGECWAMLGKNGAGKTTLLHTFAGLRRPASGTILFRDNDLARMRRRDIAQHLGVVFQDADDRFPGTVLETALIGRHPFSKAWQWESAADRAAARAALAAVGLRELEDRLVSTLSGGERRRLALATVLTQQPDLFLLDEPTNHLDVHHQITILDLIVHKTIAGNRGTAMMILHDASLAARFCDHVLLLYADGTYDAGTTQALLTETNLQRLYGHPMQRLRGPKNDVFVPV